MHDVTGNSLDLPFIDHGSDYLVTTEIFGDVTGKSYLFLTEDEFQILTAIIPQSPDPKVDFKKEFLKEVDNILSASVITRLANELRVKMYGDVPRLIESSGGTPSTLLTADFSKITPEVYVNAILFSFATQPAISLLFIWALDSRTLEKVQFNS